MCWEELHIGVWIHTLWIHGTSNSKLMPQCLCLKLPGGTVVSTATYLSLTARLLHARSACPRKSGSPSQATFYWPLRLTVKPPHLCFSWDEKEMMISINGQIQHNQQLQWWISGNSTVYYLFFFSFFAVRLLLIFLSILCWRGAWTWKERNSINSTVLTKTIKNVFFC